MDCTKGFDWKTDIGDIEDALVKRETDLAALLDAPLSNALDASQTTSLSRDLIRVRARLHVCRLKMARTGALAEQALEPRERALISTIDAVSASIGEAGAWYALRHDTDVAASRAADRALTRATKLSSIIDADLSFVDNAARQAAFSPIIGLLANGRMAFELKDIPDLVAAFTLAASRQRAAHPSYYADVQYAAVVENLRRLLDHRKSGQPAIFHQFGNDRHSR